MRYVLQLRLKIRLLFFFFSLAEGGREKRGWVCVKKVPLFLHFFLSLASEILIRPKKGRFATRGG